MLTAAVLVCLGTVVFGQGERCCTPNVWQANGRATAGTFREVEGLKVPGREHRDSVIYYDFDGERMAHEDFIEYGDGTVSSYRVIELHRERRGYLIRDNECFRFEPEPMRKMCVPEDAIYSGTFRWGAGVGHNLTVDRWEGVFREEETTEGAYAGFWTHVGCLPVSFGVFVEDYDREERTLKGEGEGLAFSEISPTISNPTAFVPPSECQAPTQIGERDAMLDRHRAFKRSLLM